MKQCQLYGSMGNEMMLDWSKLMHIFIAIFKVKTVFLSSYVNNHIGLFWFVYLQNSL
jgi:hypothetical protein